MESDEMSTDDEMPELVPREPIQPRYEQVVAPTYPRTLTIVRFYNAAGGPDDCEGDEVCEQITLNGPEDLYKIGSD
jgi:hypothetical protein